MLRPKPQDATEPGQDSFLDIVANIVGILIILVMVAGMRVRNATVQSAMADEGMRADAAALEKEQAAADSMRKDVLSVAAQVQQVTRERMLQQEQRDRLATLVAAAEQKIRSHRDKLDAADQAACDAQIKLSEAKARLEQLERDRAAVETAKAPPIQIESYPTPLSTLVEGREAHFQLRGGRVAFIPLEHLIEEFKEDARQQSSRLLHQPELTDTVGPTGGFRLRYTMVRREVSDETAIAKGKAGMYATLQRWTLIPESDDLGEPIDAALAAGSRFRTALADFPPKHTTVTIWTYPDSFGAFRRLKKELFQLGYATAARPLPFGIPIGGSPQGTKSAAE